MSKNQVHLSAECYGMDVDVWIEADSSVTKMIDLARYAIVSVLADVEATDGPENADPDG